MNLTKAQATRKTPLIEGTKIPTEPVTVRDGLAIYEAGLGPPLLLMPYPHGYTVSSIVVSPLMRLLVGLGRRVITFDPPGTYRSTRPARVDMPEMLECAQESLSVCGAQGALDVVGHSMGGLCALGLALEHPERVRRLILLDTVSGGQAVIRGRGMPLNWRPTDPDFWRFVIPALRVRRGHANMLAHKRMMRAMLRASFVDKTRVPYMHVEDGDEHRPAPVRDRWPYVALKIDYRPRLGQVRVPTLICVGRYDPQAPVKCSEELAEGIPGAQLVIFEKSGHYPHIEEPERLKEVLRAFFGEDQADMDTAYLKEIAPATAGGK